MSDETFERLKEAFSDSYRIDSELGQGGMATVYLADDLKHERKVAVKVLRPELAALIGGERFLTEIKTTAALQHPHILPLFDSGEADGFLYYVMPYVDGKSLRAHLESERQLDVAEALKIAKAVASALGYAHDHDIIHRDIKPENILMHAGQPVVADFGIALAISAAGGGRLTETGLSLGTPHYMSPEQASADRELSARSDVYSLGCMLYEMLAGQPPHTGPTAQSILVRILTEEARPLTELRRTVPPHVAAVVTKAIEKLPADRFKSAQEFIDALDNEGFTWEPVKRAKAEPAAEPAPAMAAVAGAARAWDTRSKALAGLVGFFALVAGVQMFGGAPAAEMAGEAPVLSFLVQDSAADVLLAAVGSDGAIALQRPGGIAVRRSGSLTEEVLAGTDDIGQFPAFSPDAAWLAYPASAGGGSWLLRKVQAAGGPVVTLANFESLGNMVGVSWGSDGWIYGSAFATSAFVYRVPDVGGPIDTLLVASGSEAFYTLEALPGGRKLLVTIGTNSGGAGRIVSVDIESGDTATVVSEGFTPRWSPTGHLIYAHTSGALFAVPFDAEDALATGPPVPVLDGVGVFAEVLGRYDLSRNGTMVYVRAPALGGAANELSFTMLDPDGGTETLPLAATDHWDADFSRDGRLMAYTRESHIWVYDLDRGGNRAVTEGDGPDRHNPRWSPDGNEIVYRGTQGDTAGVWVIPAGGGEPRLVAVDDGSGFNPAQWLEDGTILISTDQGDIAAVNADGGELDWLFEADWIERSPTVSPDGNWIAYGSSEGGELALWVRSWPDLGNKTRVSDGNQPIAVASYSVWSPDSRTLYYHQGSSIGAATIDTSDGFQVSERRTLSPGTPGFYLSGIHPDGRLLTLTFGAVSQDQDAGVAQLIAVTNWFTQLRERLGRAP